MLACKVGEVISDGYDIIQYFIVISIEGFITHTDAILRGTTWRIDDINKWKLRTWVILEGSNFGYGCQELIGKPAIEVAVQFNRTRTHNVFLHISYTRKAHCAF